MRVRGAVLLLWCLAGCGQDSSALEGRDFLLSRSEGYTPVMGTTIRLGFHDGELGISAGCNGMGGRYKVSDGELSVPELGSTEKGCPGDLEAQDQRVGEFVRSRPKLALDGDQLTLSSGNVTLVFLDREVADPDRPLEGTVWTIDTLVQCELASSSLNVMSKLSFGFDGMFTLQGPCNTFSGTYRAGDKIRLGEVGVTHAACLDQAAYEAQLSAVFSSNATLEYGIEADKLSLMNGDRGVRADAP